MCPEQVSAIYETVRWLPKREGSASRSATSAQEEGRHGRKAHQSRGASSRANDRTHRADVEAPSRPTRGVGERTARRHGCSREVRPEFFSRIGSKGGRTVRERRGPEFYADIGRRGGQTTRDTLGVEHYERIGRMGGLRARQREREAAPDAKKTS